MLKAITPMFALLDSSLHQMVIGMMTLTLKTVPE
jgi:hypothetical protein